jgi:hypothetical protein
VIGYVFESKGFSRVDIDTKESDPAYRPAGHLLALSLNSLQGFGAPAKSNESPTSNWPGRRLRLAHRASARSPRGGKPSNNIHKCL